MERSAADAFVRELFEYVLDRPSVDERELGHWVAAVEGGLSPVEAFRRFALCQENQQRRAALRGCATKYPNGHFYSPVVDVAEIAARRERVFARAAPLGVDLREAGQLAELARLAPHFATLPFADQKEPGLRFHYRNPSYGFGDAAIYWAMLAALRPRRIIEIGSGYSSALALDAIDRLDLDTQCTFIDPYPDLLHKVAAPIGPRHRVIADLVQNVDPALVEALEAGDILFIDSSHVVKTGSDVLFEITELLPRLRPGVMVHFHDVFYPFEYPEGWVVTKNHSWNELYVLHAFLAFSSAFEISYFNDYVARLHADALRRILPEGAAARIRLNAGGGLWLRRTPSAAGEHRSVMSAARNGAAAAA